MDSRVKRWYFLEEIVGKFVGIVLEVEVKSVFFIGKITHFKSFQFRSSFNCLSLKHEP